MANTLTNLIPSLYAGLDMVSRELVGMIPSVRIDAAASRAAVGQAVYYPITPAANVGNVTPAMTVPEPTDQTIGNDSITITKSRCAEFGWVGEEQLGLNNNGPGVSMIQADMFAQGLRALTNEVETDLFTAGVAGASRVVGDPGDQPFATDISDYSNLVKELNINGAPQSDRQFVIDNASGAYLRTLHGINDDRDYSSLPFRDQGALITKYGLTTRETGATVTHTNGTADGATTNDDGYAVGSTAFTLASAGTGAILVGDVITFAGDPNQYVVTVGDAAVGGGGTIEIAEPGIRVAIPAANTAITVVGIGDRSPDELTYDAAGLAFYRGAIVLAARAPARPEGGDVARDVAMITDPRSGLAFEVARYDGYRKVRFEVSLAWGVKAAQSRHIMLLQS